MVFKICTIISIHNRTQEVGKNNTNCHKQSRGSIVLLYGQKSLAKVSSSITLGGQGLNSSHQPSSGPGLRSVGGNSGSSSLSHHYSMSSLRKGSVSGPLQSHATSMLGSNSYLNTMTNSSNFYVARGEIR